ncbi:MAG TPA: hypothetical protein VGB82_25370 [Alphaproteobacteria bacterium]
MNPAPKTRRAKRPVRRSERADGGLLPTTKELELAAELARRWRLDLPAGYAQDLQFVRGFLDVFALDGRRNPPEQVLRRLRNARQLAWDGMSAEEIARKLDLPGCLGPVLQAYGLAQVPRSWHTESNGDAPGDDAPLVDRLTEHVLAGEDQVWAEFAVQPPAG